MALSFTFVISAVAFLANLAVILFLTQVRGRDAYARPMIWLYVCLAGLNLGLSFMVSAGNAERAWFALFLFRPFLFFLGPCFLWTVLVLTSPGTSRPRRYRLWLAGAFAFACFMTVAAGAGFLNGSRFFIREMQALPWGFVPRAGPGAALGLGGLFLLCVPGSFLLLARGDELPAGVSRGTLTGLFAVWWLGLMSNGLGLAGLNVFPPGSLVDAIMSFIITAYLHRRSTPREGSLAVLRLAGMLASLCPGALATYVLIEFILPDAPAVTGLVGLVTAAVALLVFHRWFQTPGPAKAPATDSASGPLFVRLQNEYGLTYQEARICEEAHRGTARDAIRHSLGVTSGTFRNHLSEIYRKTIDPVEHPRANRRDKWQRLTVFLHKIAES